MAERTPTDLMEQLRCAYEQGDGREQAQARVALLAAWEADRALIGRLACPSCGEVGVAAAGRPDVHSCYDRAALHAQQLAERNARIATLTAQRDALVPMARVVNGVVAYDAEQAAAARAALAAIEQEQAND